MTLSFFKKLTLSLSIILFLWLIIHSAVIIADGLNDELEVVDVAVVLGNKVELNGQPSDRLQARLDKAVQLYEENYFNYIIVSGGTGKEGWDEAEVMKNYLIAQGIQEASIIEDPDGYNSYMTAENSKAIMDELDLHSVMVISQYFHISRTKLAFEKVGFETIASAHADIFDSRDVYSTLREFPAYYTYLIK
ncbi:YdcF family protein [Bacillus sp. AGMB 02131]|uniref:YdcF family protein n=1 Tax=Peribacillus faecalis TaxID=2772559 RepID=A0A927CTM7_9BACI|nr:YdcF family protein [Peribacillus faecalis]MBD3107236.1 YdcF family protein [Peribacillus faecalis]